MKIMLNIQERLNYPLSLTLFDILNILQKQYNSSQHFVTFAGLVEWSAQHSMCPTVTTLTVPTAQFCPIVTAAVPPQHSPTFYSPTSTIHFLQLLTARPINNQHFTIYNPNYNQHFTISRINTHQHFTISHLNTSQFLSNLSGFLSPTLIKLSGYISFCGKIKKDNFWSVL